MGVEALVGCTGNSGRTCAYSVNRGRQFARRQAVYERLDQEFFACTRFFAAAALTNSVLARLFKLLPATSLPHAYRFLSAAGEVLQTENLLFAQRVRRQTLCMPALDHYLVTNEQRLLQALLNECTACADQYGSRICEELNGLMNGNIVTMALSRMFGWSRQLSWIFARIRQDLGLMLDFANESHRIHIGLGMIRYIRNG